MAEAMLIPKFKNKITSSRENLEALNRKSPLTINSEQKDDEEENHNVSQDSITHSEEMRDEECLSSSSTIDSHEEEHCDQQLHSSHELSFEKPNKRPKITHENNRLHSLHDPMIPVCISGECCQLSPFSSALSQSVSRHDRIRTIVSACAAFDHNNALVHDSEIAAGSDAALCKHLAFLQLLILKKRMCQEGKDSIIENVDDSSESEIVEEIQQTLTVLEMLYRCTTTQLSNSFEKIGKELLPLLLSMLEDCIHKHERRDGPVSITSDQYSKDLDPNNVIMTKGTKIMAHLARTTQCLVPLANHRGFLSILRRISVTATLPDKSRFSALWTLGNLGCDADNMIMMANHPGLLDSLLEVADRDSSPEARCHAVKAMMNLAWRPENKTPMSEIPRLLSSMLRMLLYSGIVQARRHAASCLRFLASAPPKTKLRIVLHDNGSILSSVVNAASSDKDRYVRDCATGILSNLSCKETSKVMGEHPGLFDILAKVAVGDGGKASKIAAAALCSLSEHIQSANTKVLSNPLTPRKIDKGVVLVRSGGSSQIQSDGI